jgi:hypothetical protein
MGGGLMQLVAYGAQDIYLTGNPQITFFKVVYRRHTNFSMETISQTINGNSTNTTGGSSTVTISRNGDLVHKVYVNFKSANTNNFLSSLDQVELEIGGQRIDRHSGQWLATWLDLSTPAGRAYEVSTLIGDSGTTADFTTPGVGSTDGKVNVAQLPLQFWFCRNPGLALPLIALQYHEVKLKFEWKGIASASASDFDVLCDYIYLDTDERRRFAQVSHEYLIEQVQEQTEGVTASSSANLRLNFNHPVKELIWSFGAAAGTNALMGQSTGPVSSGSTPPTARLQLNGHDRFADMPMEYFGLRQCIDYHSAVPGPNLGQTLEGGYATSGSHLSGSVCSDFMNAVYVYSFALKPEEHQPSGTCNFSRIDNAKLICSDTGVSTDTCKIFAVNYNVLRIMSGMGGLAYSN